MAAKTFVQFRAPSVVEEALAARCQDEQSLGQVAARDLARYYTMLRLSLPPLTEGEASLIVETLNGTLSDTTSARLLWAEVDDAIRYNALADKWGVGGPALVAKLRALPPCASLAIADAGERFWLPGTVGDMSEQLRIVGLIDGESEEMDPP